MPREMKDSRIVSIGTIPIGWQTTQLKYKVLLNGRIGFRGYTQLDLVGEDEGAITLSPSNLHNGKMDYSKCAYISWLKYNESPEIKIRKGYILLVKTGSSYGKAAIVEELPMPATINPQLLVVKPVSIHNKYLLYIFLTSVLRHQIENAVVGGTIPTVSQEKINNFHIPFPSAPEQEAIVVFLDAKCAEIDSLYTDIEEQIKTLEEYKRSVITEAVTKGLNSIVEMKDSGIEWIRDIPAHWNILRGKYVFAQKSDHGNIKSLVLLSPTQNYGVIPQEMYEKLSGFSAVKLNENTDLSQLKTVHKGAFVISLRSFQGGFEYSNYEGVVSPAYQVFYPIIPVCDGYFKYLFKTQIFIDKMNSYTMSLRDGKNIAFSDFGRTYIPIPPIDEQKEIVDYLDKKCHEIDIIIKQKKEQLILLDEYKKSLIYEYVTGKKEVVTNE